MIPKIIVQLKGGIGNQMFQYAMGRALALRSNGEVLLDVGWYETVKNRFFILDKFGIQARLATNKELALFNKFRSDSLFSKLWRRISPRCVKESNYNVYDQSVKNVKQDIYLVGNWQTEKYFIDYSSQIKQDFTLSAGVLFNPGAGSVALHIRRGDYVSDKNTNLVHGVCSLDYYKNAVDWLNKKIPGLNYYIFTDDVAWATKNLNFIQNQRMISGTGLKDYEELTFFSKCEHQIIANSSFSWWGAWLNNNHNKIVIAPKRWFLTNAFDDRDIVPDSWIKL